jgi:hypothetical protein
MARLVIIGDVPQRRYVDRTGIPFDPAQWEELPEGADVPPDVTDATYIQWGAPPAPRRSLWQRLLEIRVPYSSLFLFVGVVNFLFGAYQLFFHDDIPLGTLDLVFAFGFLILGRVEALHER